VADGRVCEPSRLEDRDRHAELRSQRTPQFLEKIIVISCLGPCLNERLTGGYPVPVGAVRRHQHGIPRHQIADRERQHIGRGPSATASTRGAEPGIQAPAQIGGHGDPGREDRRIGLVFQAPERLGRGRSRLQAIRHHGDLLAVAEDEPSVAFTGGNVVTQRIVPGLGCRRDDQLAVTAPQSTRLRGGAASGQEVAAAQRAAHGPGPQHASSWIAVPRHHLMHLVHRTARSCPASWSPPRARWPPAR
jgi:hypothetical protein